MFKTRMSGNCFEGDHEQCIVLRYSAKSECSSLDDFITQSWTQEYEKGFGETLNEWFEYLNIESISAEAFPEIIKDYSSGLIEYISIELPKIYNHAARLKKDEWNDVMYAAESEHAYIFYWWYTTA